MAQQSAFGLTSLYDPSIAVDQAALDRQMALAQALRQQAMTPVDVSGRQIGGVAYKVSPLEGLAKALQAYQANKADEANDKSRLGLSQKTAAALQQMVSGMFGDSPSGAPAPVSEPNGGRPAGVTADAMTAGGFPQPAQPTALAQVAPNPQADKMRRAAMAAFMRGDNETASKLIANMLEFTPEQKNMAAKNIDPARLGAAEVAKVEKEANAPTRLGANFYGTPKGEIVGLPGSVAGSINVQDPGVPGGWRSVPQAGALPAIKAATTAETLGKNPGRDAQGNPLPFDEPMQVPPAVQAGRDDQRRKILEAELAQEKDPKNRAAIQTELNALGGGTAMVPRKGVYAEPPLGTEHAQRGLDTSWEALKTANREAQNTKSYLQNIVTAAEKGAIVGPGAERRELIQGMLQLAGIKEEVNTNATTQTQLLNKYSNQIVARLGQGGLATDAARAILQSAYPGQHMNVEAIREAVGNLSGAQDMTMAKSRFLQDSAIKRDTTAYQQREIQFDQAADPRIWQAKAIKDPERRKAFMRELVQQDPTLPQRVKALEGMGAL